MLLIFNKSVTVNWQLELPIQSIMSSRGVVPGTGVRDSSQASAASTAASASASNSNGPSRVGKGGKGSVGAGKGGKGGKGDASLAPATPDAMSLSAAGLMKAFTDNSSKFEVMDHERVDGALCSDIRDLARRMHIRG